MLSRISSIGFIVTGVQSVVTSLDRCGYSSSDGSCSGNPTCIPMCIGSGNFCPWIRCDGYEQNQGVTLNQCYTDGSDKEIRCTDDGTAAQSCKDFDLCVVMCADGGACSGNNCWNLGMNLAEFGVADCDGFYQFMNANYGMEWDTCFDYNFQSATVSCNEGSDPSDGGSDPSDGGSDPSDGGSDSSDDTGMIIGIVVGAVVIVSIIVAVVIYRRSRKAL